MAAMKMAALDETAGVQWPNVLVSALQSESELVAQVCINLWRGRGGACVYVRGSDGKNERESARERERARESARERV